MVRNHPDPPITDLCPQRPRERILNPSTQVTVGSSPTRSSNSKFVRAESRATSKRPCVRPGRAHQLPIPDLEGRVACASEFESRRPHQCCRKRRLARGPQLRDGTRLSIELRRVRSLVRGAISSPASTRGDGHVSEIPTLVLNADFQPLSYFPLSLFGWEDAVKAVVKGSHVIVAEYDQVVRSPSTAMRLPSVIALRAYVRPPARVAFTRFNVFLRDRFVASIAAPAPPERTDLRSCPAARGRRRDIMGRISRRRAAPATCARTAAGETPPEAVRANGASAYGRPAALPA